MANEDIVLRIKALMDTGDVSGAVKELQGVFNRLKLTDNIKGDFDKVFKDLAKSAEAFENKAKGSFESAADVNALKKSRKEFDNLLNGMLKSLKNLSTQDMEDIFQFDLSGIKNLTQQIEQLQKKAKETAAAAVDIQKVEKTLKDLKDMTSKTGGFDLLEDLKSGDIDSAITKFEKLQETLKGFAKGSDTAQGAVNDFLNALKAGDIEKINSTLDILTSKIEEIGKGKNGNLLFFADGLKDIALEIQKATEETKEFKNQIKTLETEKIENIGSQSREGAAGIERMGSAVQEVKGSFKQLGDNAENAAQDTRNLNKEIGELGQRASYFLSLENSVDLFRQGVRKAIDTVKELDAAMAETAVVTDFSIGDMWDKLPQYTKMANELGVATQGVYEASTLYYQQGLQTEQVMALTNETLKMARIAGLEYAEATDLMTAALRGFNMEINETSAQRVNDVYSELAAITAADTNEIATAMTKTASIANNANMELETTAALLAQMIETTREPAETAGTAMKTIVARFTEMKKSASEVFEVDGEEVNVNKVEEALRSAGVALRDTKGEFRDLDDVFLELSSKWNSLDNMTQRYIATTAAGSRQQSRFIAMMQDYDRTIELVNAAYNSAGSSSQQFEKTQESLESKLARLKNAWDTFLMGIADDKIVKSFVDALTGLINGFNKLTENLDGIGGSAVRIIAVFAGFRGVKAIIEKLIKSFAILKGEAQGLTILQSLTQRINNFKLGKGFVVNADVNTKGANAKITALKTNWSSFKAAVTEPTTPVGTIVGFEVLDGKIVATSITAEGATESIELGLSEVGTQAILTSEQVEEIGKDFTTGSAKAKLALDAIQKELAETIAMNELLDKSQNGDVLEFKGKKFTVTDKKREFFKNRQSKLEGDAQKLTEGTWASGFKTMLATLKPILVTLGAVLAVLGAIAATAAVIYNTSPLKGAKNDVETAKGAVEDFNRALEEAKKQGDALTGVLDELGNRNTTFDTLIKGSAEWYEAIATSNEELLKQIELLKSLGYDVGYSYDENGMIQVDNEAELKTAKTKSAQKQIELQKGKMAAGYTAEVEQLEYELIKENSKNSFKTGTERYSKDQLANPISYDYSSNQTDKQMEDIGKMMGYALQDFMNADSFSEDQKAKLENLSRSKFSQTFSLYAEDEKELKAGQKVISNMDNVYDTYYSDQGLENRLGNQNKYVIDKDGHAELKINEEGGGKRDITADDLNEDFLKDLGYADWNEAASALGLNYDSTKGGVKGLYKTLEDGTKEYINVTKHGRTDTEANWEKLMGDPSSGANVDAGFLAYKLAKNKSGAESAKSLSKLLIGDMANQVLYGTENWEDKKSNTDDSEMDKAINESINQANARKRAIYNNLVGEDDPNTTLKEGIRDADGNAFFDTGKGKSFTEETMRDFASNVQALETDTNFVTGQAYQTFITSKMAKRKEDGLSFDDQALADLEKQYYGVFKDLDLTDATASLDTLNEKIKQGSKEAEELKANLTAEGGSLDISHQFSDLLASGALDEISEEISEISDEAGNIDVSATRELVDSNKDLKNIMDEFNVSGYAMGKILTDIQSGELTLTEINEGLIESYKLLYSAMGQAEDVLYDLRNADLGEDYTEIGRTYEERYDTAKDLYDRKAYGSENFAGNIKSLIGDEAWQDLLTENGGSNKKAYEAAVKKYKLNKNDGNLYGSFSSLISEDAADPNSPKNKIFKNENGQITYDFSGFESYDAILDHMVSAFGISREYAKAMLADMATYSDTLQNDLNALNAAAAATKNYESMYFEEATDKDGNPVVDENGQPVMNAYTSQTDAEIAAIYGQTDQWETAQEEAQKKYEKENEGKSWDDLTAEERKEKTTSKFKDTHNIKNTVEDEEGNQQQITKVDSQGNKYYKDKEGKTKIKESDKKDTREYTSGGTRNERKKDGTQYQYKDNEWKNSSGEAASKADQAALNADSVQAMLQSGFQSTVNGVEVPITFESVAEQAQMETQDVIQGLQEIASDPIVQQMATELNSEEYDAWLAANYGENAPEIMLSAGFSQESIANVAAAKDQMITQIQAVAQALESMSVTIPLKMPETEVKGSILGIPVDLIKWNAINTSITIGGKGTETNFVGTPPGASAGSTSGEPVEIPFTTKKKPSGKGYESGDDEDNGDGDGGSSGKNDTDAKDENLQRKLAAYKRKLENGEINAMEYSQKKRETLRERQLHLEEKKSNQLKENKYDGQIYDYSEELDDFVIKAEEYNKLNDKEKNLVDEELQKLREINDELNEIEDELGNMSPEELANEQEKNQSQAALDNYNKDLEEVEDERHDLSIAQEVAGKGPSEVQDLFNMGFAVEGMLLEGQEVQTRLGMRNEYESQMAIEAENLRKQGYLGEKGDAATPYYLDEATGAIRANEEFFESSFYATMDEDDQKIIKDKPSDYEDLYQKNRENEQELSGGKLQKNLLDMADATNTFGKELQKGSEASGKTTRATKAMEKAIDSLDIDDRLKDPLKQLGSAFGKAIDSTEILEKDFSGLGKTLDKIPVSDGLKKLVSTTLGKDAADKMGSGGMGSAIGSLVGEGGALSGMPGADMIGKLIGGGKIGEIVGAAVSGTIGGPAGALLSLASGNMMSMGMDFMNAGMGMAGQMKDMASQMIQYVVQFVTTVINWWINREDWLYNLLSAIEQEVHNFNRQEQVEERFRLYSDEGLNDLVSAWEAMRVSLERQIDLNEQLIKSRQAELQFLNLTNLPFSPAFYYDYTEERVIENPWVYDIYVLLLDLGAALPEIGQIFSSIKQLMEDNKKRMEDGVKEIEDAREEILELEKKQLELRTKYMEDEIELEELVMDTIIEKQQEEIDELSAMNDAISAGNEKLIETLNNNLERIRQQRENEETEEELGEKERRLAYLRQDTSNANRAQIMDLKEELQDERRSYTDELIDQKISALEEQNELAAEQRQKQIELLQGQLDYTERYGLQWAEAQTLIKNGFDSEGRLRVGTDLFDMLMSKEDFTSMGLGSTRQVQQIMDWNVTSIAAAAFREINDIWDEGFGNFEMSNDVHDQSRLHLWADREVDYRQLPSWLSFLQPAYNTVQDYFWRTGNNLGAFAETAWGSGKNSTSILGKTVVPLLQEILGTVKGKYEEYNSLSVADGYVETTTGVITSTMENVGYDWGERMVKSLGNGFAALGDSFTEGIRAMAQSNSLNNQTSTQSIGDITVQVHIDSEDTEDGYKFGENIANAFREGLSNLSIFK